MDPNEKVRQRAEQIIKVRSGLITATQAAENLNISRKNYYKWEERALKGMMDALADQSSGRPGLDVDREKEMLKRKLLEAEEQIRLLEQRLHIKAVMSEPVGKEAKKKVRTDKTSYSGCGGTKTVAERSVQGTVYARDTGVLKPDEMEGPAQPTGGTGKETGAPEVRRG